jgi:hypothetical protein
MRNHNILTSSAPKGVFPGRGHDPKLPTETCQVGASSICRLPTRLLAYYQRLGPI